MQTFMAMRVDLIKPNYLTHTSQLSLMNINIVIREGVFNDVFLQVKQGNFSFVCFFWLSFCVVCQ